VSEYQYYEFQAIDNPLDADAQRALRRITTRAQITSRSLVNTYQWGNFKGDPRRLVERWFDLFIYWTNWGTRTLMLRAPSRFVELKAVRPYCANNALDARTANGFTIIEFGCNLDPTPDDFPDEGSVSAPFTMLRSNLLRGDRSCLYLGWLLGVQDGLVKGTALEPPRPAGVANPSVSLQAFIEFFGLDTDLLAAACEQPETAGSLTEPSPAELRAFIKALPDSEKTKFLCQAVLKPDSQLSLEIRQRVARIKRKRASATPPAPRRAAQEILDAGEALLEKRRRRRLREKPETRR
jgi:hypothetical protein